MGDDKRQVAAGCLLGGSARWQAAAGSPETRRRTPKYATVHETKRERHQIKEEGKRISPSCL
jgi:hypothetical protein